MDKLVHERLIGWREAGLLDPDQVERILAFEAQVPPRERRRFAALAVTLGVLMVGAGVLLFVAANWPYLGPRDRFLLVLALAGGFHLAGAAAARGRSRLAPAFHGLGTLALGAGIFLAGQIFNLQEHWPGGILLWALGAWAGYALLRDWIQGLLAALLTPAWLMAEWVNAVPMEYPYAHEVFRGVAAGCLGLAFTYLTARMPGRDGPLRRALAWAGGLALIPAALGVVVLHSRLVWDFKDRPPMTLHGPVFLAGWAAALGAPLVLAVLARGRAAWMNALALLWILALAAAAAGRGPAWGVHALGALGGAGLILWGLREGREERVNLGMAGFAIALAAFYFSSVMDKLGRSLGLMVLGLLFLAGGWQLERLRRRLTARIGRERT